MPLSAPTPDSIRSRLAHTEPRRPLTPPPPAPSPEPEAGAERFDNVVQLRAVGEPSEPNAGLPVNDDAPISLGALDALVTELIGMVRHATDQRDDALAHLELVRAENRRLLAERQQLTGLATRWQTYALDIERWADDTQRFHEARLEGVEQQLLRTFHEKERAIEIADELLAGRLWLRRWRKKTLADELDALRPRSSRGEDLDATQG